MLYMLNKALIILIISSILITSIDYVYASNELYIVVTFPYLYDDIKSVLCPGDVVVNIVKPGIDPHEYQLSVEDINVIKKADIIISTAHTHFEQKIKKMIEENELDSILIEIPYLQNTKIFKNPSTGIENYHELLFYPENYIVFLKYLKSILVSLRPECTKNYEENIEQFILKLQSFVNKSVRPNRIAVLDSPRAQYIVAGLGLNTSYILMKEEEIPITPEDIKGAEEMISKYNNSIIVIINGSKAASYLSDLANRYGRKVLVLPDPLASTSIISILENAINVLNTLDMNISHSVKTNNVQLLQEVYIILIILSLSFLFMLIPYELYKRKKS
jgi:zinc/manganese transport system substrate-binding protein